MFDFEKMDLCKNKYLKWFYGFETREKERKIQDKNLELAANLQADSILKNMMIHQIWAQNIQNFGLYVAAYNGVLHFFCGKKFLPSILLIFHNSVKNPVFGNLRYNRSLNVYRGI